MGWFYRFIGVCLMAAVAVCPAVRAQEPLELFAQGFDLLEQGKAAEAIARFEQGLRADPANVDARFYLGEAYAAAGQPEKAAGQWRKVLELGPKTPAADKARTRLAALPSGGADRPELQGVKVGAVVRDCPECPELVIVPPGQFVMGSPRAEAGREENEGPPRVVTIARPLAVGRYEVTFEEWDACAGAGACPQARDEGWGRGKRPVINVSFDEAGAYTRWLSQRTGKAYRLLSEAEWEYAARAGLQDASPWGGREANACAAANVSDQSRKRRFRLSTDAFSCDDEEAVTAPAGRYRPNGFGLHDTLGNVWEWVLDCASSGYEGAPTDGSAATGSCNRRVVRGGSWYDRPETVRLAQRKSTLARERSSTVGLRVVRPAP